MRNEITSQPRRKTSFRATGWSIAGLATVALAAFLAYSLYPEAMRTLKMHSM